MPSLAAQVVERCQALRTDVAAALIGCRRTSLLSSTPCGEARRSARCSGRFHLLELPAYDRPFDTDEVVNANAAAGELRDPDELGSNETRPGCWHWRARTTELQQSGVIELPARYSSFDQLIAAPRCAATTKDCCPSPIRGDFRAYGKVYRHLSPEQHAEAHSIAAERHHALNWLAGEGTSWDDVPLDT